MNASRRWLVLGLASAVLNVFLIGFLAGRHAFGPGGCGMRGFRHDHGPLARRISEEDRARLREKLEAVRDAREQVRSALLQEPYQAPRLEAALLTLRQRSGALQVDMHQELLEMAGRMSLEQRRKLADARFSRPERPH
jgi:uncharacterized membrane protein